ncbi:MAG: ATP-binding protein [Porticoccaceae bacterium]
MKLMRSLFWKVFLIIWITNMLLISAGALMIRLEYIKRYQELVDDARIHGLTEYIVSRYEAGMDTRDFRRPTERRGRFPRIVIRDMDTALIVFSSRRHIDDLSGDIYWDYISPANGRYRVYIEDDPFFDYEEPAYPLALVMLGSVITAIFSLLLTYMITRPILKLREHVEGLGADLSAPLEKRLLERQDEFGELARSVEEMSERIRELIDSKQRLFFDISHELRAPLARMQVAAEIVRDRSERNGEDLTINDRVDREIRALDQLITELMNYIKEDFTRLPLEQVDLCELVEALIADQDFASSSHKLVFRCELDKGLTITTKPILLERAIRNLLENAIKYSPEGTPVEIGVAEAGEAYCICVMDRGPGVPEDQLREVLEPFTRLHPESIEGVGLGLSIVVRAVEEIGGQLELKNREEGGLSTCIFIPR